MSIKRNRATYEADLKHQNPFVFYGTPLPPLDPNARDDGSYVPIWKQEVTDERGRKRLHGAFTGGFSAGYFNTVGSKEGWTPSTFVSSRSNRKKDDRSTVEQRPEDFMDDEDLVDAAEAQKVQTADDYAGLGSTEGDVFRHSGLLDLLKIEGETMGVKLLKKMGWREGQGVGPKVRRKARLGGLGSQSENAAEMHLFAPENTRMISFMRKNDHKGLGFDDDAPLARHKSLETSVNSDGEEDFGITRLGSAKPQRKPARGGIGIGILNDTGSDDEDAYEIGPRISYNKVIGTDKKKKKKPAVNGAIRPVFISKKASIAKASMGFRKCHDGRLPLDGFVLSSDPDTLNNIISSDGKYLPPKIPNGWVSTKKAKSDGNSSGYVSTADAAKSSKLDPISRASLLGEAPLPGKSVFDYISSAARDRLAFASGKTNLPAGLGEIPEGYATTDEERRREMSSQIPKLDRDVAIAALGRGVSGWMPYAEDESKRSRYRAFLEGQAGIREVLPEWGSGVTKDDCLKELQEFVHCAQIFKPMTGMMATRFTSSSSSPTLASDSPIDSASLSLLTKPAPKVEDPAEAAAKLGMFGPMTRSSQDFYPTRLLCKRFNVKPPAHVQLDPERTPEDAGEAGPGSGHYSSEGRDRRPADLVSKSAIDDILKESGGKGSTIPFVLEEPTKIATVDVERNEALEGERAGDAVFKAIFGDDSDIE